MENNIINFVNIQKKKGDYFMNKLSKEKMLFIESKTQSLLKDVDFEKSPYVDIVSLVKKDRFTVEPKDMDIDTTGCLLVNNDETNKERIIMVNTKFKNPDNEEDVVFKKSRFITAHEYGHFILHKKDGYPIYAHRDTDYREDEIELEADYFARSLLMPLDKFKMYYNAINEIGNGDEVFTVAVLSRLFKVTKNKVKKRVEDITILG